MNHIKKIIVVILICFTVQIFANEEDMGIKEYKHSLETSPISPLLQMAGAGIWGLEYTYAITEKDEIKAGISYMNIFLPEGNTSSIGLIFGYRRFIWKGLYAEYEIWPGYDNFYEKNENKYYAGIDLWNEFRLGYQFEFQLNNFPVTASFAWPFGFGLYSSNKPESFYDRMNESFSSKFFYQFPLIFVGFKF